jgi:hypothetical protein
MWARLLDLSSGTFNADSPGLAAAAALDLIARSIV